MESEINDLHADRKENIASLKRLCEQLFMLKEDDIFILTTVIIKKGELIDLGIRDSNKALGAIPVDLSAISICNVKGDPQIVLKAIFNYTKASAALVKAFEQRLKAK